MGRVRGIGDASGIDQVRGDPVVVLAEEVGCVLGKGPIWKVGGCSGWVVICGVGLDVLVEL